MYRQNYAKFVCKIFVRNVFFHQSYLPCSFKIYRNLRAAFYCQSNAPINGSLGENTFPFGACLLVHFTAHQSLLLMRGLTIWLTACQLVPEIISSTFVVHSSIFCLEHYVLELSFLHRQRQMAMLLFFICFFAGVVGGFNDNSKLF